MFQKSQSKSIQAVKWVSMLTLLVALSGCVSVMSQESTVSNASAQSVVQSAGWSNNVSISFNGDTMTIQSNGVPSHETLDFYAIGNRVINNPTSAQNYSYTLPLQPQLAVTPTNAGAGIIGIAISGAAFFNPYEGDQVTYALEDNFEVNGAPFIDACNGHATPNNGMYHYHGIPYCITDAVDSSGQHSKLVGYLLDGFSIYGPQDVGGGTPTNLDACNGHFGSTPEFPEGIYHYHTSEARPYVPTCYSGEITITQRPPRR